MGLLNALRFVVKDFLTVNGTLRVKRFVDFAGASVSNLGTIASATFTGGTFTGVSIVDSTASNLTGTVSGASVTATGSSTARTLAARAADAVNVLDHGAVGDEVANDTAAFQAAVNVGGEIIIPAGTYLLDEVTISEVCNIVLCPGAIVKQRSAYNGTRAIFYVAAGGSGTTFDGGTFDGNRTALASSWLSGDDWTAVRASGATDVTVKNATIQNFATWALMLTGDRTCVDGVLVSSCGKAFLIQESENVVLRGIVVQNCGNNGLAIYQHLFELRGLTYADVNGVSVTGFAPTADGLEPYPIAIAINRCYKSTFRGIAHSTFNGVDQASGRKNGGVLISYAEDCTFSEWDINDCIYGIEGTTVLGSTFSDIRIDGEYETDSAADTIGMWLRYGGQVQTDTADSSKDTLISQSSAGNVIQNIVTTRNEIGLLLTVGNCAVSNVVANGNTAYGVQLTGANASDWFPAMPFQVVGGVSLTNVIAKANGFAGCVMSGVDGVEVNGGDYSDNGQDSSLGATYQCGILLLGALTGGVGAVSLTGVRATDTQGWTKTAGGTFTPGSTDVDNRYSVSVVDPDFITVGQHITLVGATSGGDVTAKVVERDRWNLVLDFGGAETLVETSNLTALTGTISSVGQVVTGVGTAFETEIPGHVWIKASGQFAQAHRVQSDTGLIIYPAYSPAVSGATAEKLTVDVTSSTTQQYGVYADASVTGPLAINGVDADGVGTSAVSLGATASMQDVNELFGEVVAVARGKLSTGTTTYVGREGQTLAATYAGSGYGGAAITSYTNGSGATAPLLDIQRSKGSTVGTLTTVAAGDTLGYISFRGSDGTGFIPAAWITAAVDNTPGTSDMPGRLIFSTTADGAATPTERLRISSTGLATFANAVAINGSTTLGDAAADTVTINAGTTTIPSGTATANAGNSYAVTVSKMCGVITTDSLTTAAGSAQAITVTNTTVAATDIIMVTRSGGTSAGGTPVIKAVPGSGSFVITIDNKHASAAFDGTFVVSFLVFKAG